MSDNEVQAGHTVAETTEAPDHTVTEDDDMAKPQSTKFAAFQFYPRDFLTSDKVARMSLTEIGIYITLLSYAWLGNGLPVNELQLARLVRIPLPRFKKIWAGVLSECFVAKGGKFVNPRQERQRKELQDYVAGCQRGGEQSAKTRRSKYGSAQPPKSPRSDVEVTPNTASASSSSKGGAPPAPAPRPMAPLHDNSHKKHALCGRVCLHASQFNEFISRRNHDGARKEIDAWAFGIIKDWTDGKHARDEPGDPFDFWRAQYAERWPATPFAKPKPLTGPPSINAKDHPYAQLYRPATGTEGAK